MADRGDEQDRSRDAAHRRELAAALGGASPARSALTLRLILATFGLIVCGGAAVLFAVLGLPLPVTLAAAFFAAIAAVDITIIARRKHHGEPGRLRVTVCCDRCRALGKHTLLEGRSCDG